ncbi:penicillin-binding transpeptidase domain-containing protein [Bacillus sp. OTU530]|uniref:penicillin-binding transpeptidase domain-containing protein n=1 Tax=Bacillus sp. OTU530 TaxID=3043862 RepID=UPI00406CEDD7
MDAKKLHMNRGAGLLMLIFLLLFFLLVLRFLYIQWTGTVHGQSLTELAEAKHNKKGVLEGKRGTIYDQTGSVLAQDITAYKLIAMLKGDNHVEDKEQTAEKLATVLDMDADKILAKLNNEKAYQVEFGVAGNNLTKKQKEKITAMKLKGITFIDGKMRSYPNGNFASYVVGYAKPNDEGVLEGKFGLEQTLDSYLHDENGSISYEGDSHGLLLGNSEEKVKPAKNGDDVYLTIDQRVQSFLEDAMTKAAEHYDPSMLLGVVADPKTGKILAMSSRPSYDPNIRDITYFLNNPIAYAYEPGSTMKVFTLAAAVNEGVYQGSAYYQSGAYAVGGTQIRDHNNGVGWGSITFNEGVQRSSNVAFAIIAEKQLGFDRLRQYIHRFGLDEKTGIDLPGESGNTILFDKQIQKVTTAFGQGSTVTPIQQIQAATAIANNGKMMKPYVIDRIVDSETGKVAEQHRPQEVGEPITEDTAKKVRQLLETVVTAPTGTGGAYKIDGYSVAGKTGTAQIPGPDGRYMSGRENYIFSFLGMAPADDPQLLVYVAVKQPHLKDAETGATPLADIFKSVTKNSLQYLKVKPSVVKDTSKLAAKESIAVPALTGEALSDAKEKIESKGLRPIVLGEGSIVKQSPQAGDKVLKGERILLAGTNNKMPNLIGWSLRDVMNLANVLGLELKTSGKGYVTEQSIGEGIAVKKGDLLEVKLVPPDEGAQ